MTEKQCWICRRTIMQVEDDLYDIQRKILDADLIDLHDVKFVSYGGCVPICGVCQEIFAELWEARIEAHEDYKDEEKMQDNLI